MWYFIVRGWFTVVVGMRTSKGGYEWRQICGFTRKVRRSMGDGRAISFKEMDYEAQGSPIQITASCNTLDNATEMHIMAVTTVLMD
jgi:hypothetical protein